MSLLSTSQEPIHRVANGVTPEPQPVAGSSDMRGSTRFFRNQVHRHLGSLRGGQLQLSEQNQHQVFGQRSNDALRGEMCVVNPRFYRRVALRGSMGAAESYMDGDWLADDLPAVLRVFARDWSVSCKLDSRWRRLRSPFAVAWNRLRKNTLRGSRKNIAVHYDLSNDFYRLWLDDTMAYSSGIFADDCATLEQASRNKFDIACRRLDLQQDDRLLEIGTGWGGLALHAAEHYGCRVTTTTISKQQGDYARDRFASRQLDEQITLLDKDYRDLSGQYDKIMSIEMIEAVGHEYLRTFFAKCNQLLKPGGRFMLQAITIPDQRYDRYRSSIDFIQKYIFPGGALPSLGAIQAATGRCTGLVLTQLEDYAQHYARTLACWRDRFFSRLDEVKQLGFDERFVRTWDYYLSYCEAGFRERQIGLAHLVFEKR